MINVFSGHKPRVCWRGKSYGGIFRHNVGLVNIPLMAPSSTFTNFLGQLSKFGGHTVLSPCNTQVSWITDIIKLRSKIFLFLSNCVIFEQSVALFWISFDFELLLVYFVFAIFISNFTTAFVISCLGEGGSRSFLSQGRNVDRINFLMALLGSSFSNRLDYDEDRRRRWL